MTQAERTLVENDRKLFDWLNGEEGGIADKAQMRTTFINEMGMNERTFDRSFARLVSVHRLFEYDEESRLVKIA